MFQPQQSATSILKRFKHYKATFFISLLMASPMMSFAQRDSLFTAWQEVQLRPNHEMDTAATVLLNNLARTYQYTNTDSTVYFAEKALSLAKKQRFISGEAWACNILGIAWYVNGSYELALEAYLQSLKLFEQEKNAIRVGWAKNNIGLIYIAQERYEQAITQYTELIQDPAAVQDSALLAAALFNLGLAHDHNGAYEKALEHLNAGLEVSSRNKQKRLVNLSFNRIGEVYFHMGDYKNAKAFYSKVVEANDESNLWELAFAHTGLAQTFLAEGEHDKAIAHGRLSYDYAREVKAKWDASRAIKVIAQAYAAAENYEQAYEFQKLHQQYSDSLHREARDKELNYLHLQQKEIENAELANINAANEQKIHVNKLVNIGIGIMAIFLSVMAFMSYRSNKLKSRLNKKLLKKNSDVARQNMLISKQKTALENLNSTKDKLFSIISHDLKSPLSSVLATLDLIKRGVLSQEEQNLIFKKLHHRVFTVNQLLNNLLHWANAQQMGIEVRKKEFDISKVVEQTLSVARLMAEEKNVMLEHHSNGAYEIVADEDHVRIILQNLIGNAIKFTPEGGKVMINYTREQQYQVIEIIDNGIGMSPDKLHQLFNVAGTSISGKGTNKETGTGIGLMLARQFIQENGGKLEIESQEREGTKVKAYFETSPSLHLKEINLIKN